MNTIFGPIYSRRFGFSLGIDLSPAKKQCNFDCLYCELAPSLSVEKQEDVVGVETIIKQLQQHLDDKVDVITLTANGEPTLYPYLDELIEKINIIKKNTQTLILTNSATLVDEKVFHSLLKLDQVKFSLDAVSEDIFKKIDRPHPHINIKTIIQKMIEFTKLYQGKVFIEILFVKGVNDTPKEIAKLNEVLLKLHNVTRIDIGTIDRPPAYNVKEVSYQELHQMALLFDKKLPIHIVSRSNTQPHNLAYSDEEILNTLDKRPLSWNDILFLFDTASQERFKKLVKSGKIVKKKVGNIEFFAPFTHQKRKLQRKKKMLEKQTNLFYPNKAFAKDARIKNMCEYQALQEEAYEDYEGFWGRFAKEKITWKEPFHTVLDESNHPFVKWFDGGKLNVSEQCIDRHLDSRKNKAAIIFEGDRGDKQIITYLELYYNVNRFANLLKNQFDVKKGDRVVIYMPMIPEAAYAMLACARIGAIHSVVFGGFSAEALRDRIEDADAKVVITADGAYRKDKPYMLKPIVDEALKGETPVNKVLVIERNGEDITWISGRDYSYNELIKTEDVYCEAEVMESEDPLFLLYTSGSTGKPKGVQHNQAGYILWAQMTMEWVFDVKENDTYWCTADIGWITGHTYIVYGPLAMGATTVMFEGVPTYPDAGRPWKMVEEYKINQFYTAPTAIRVLHKMGEEEPSKYDLSSLKVLGTVGEPIDPPAWKWYYEKVGNSQCAIVDTYWQTETGGHIISALPGATPIKPACATLPLPGIMGEILDPQTGKKVEVGETGYMCITRPWPSQIRGVWQDEERFVKSYFSDVKKDEKAVYFTGDGAVYDENGYITITGRVDDVINVSGHRMGTAEIEAAIKKHPNVAEVAVVGKPHDIKGEAIFAYVVLKSDNGIADEVEEVKAINAVIQKEIGNIAICDDIVFVPGLPKTRSGKIMRRILRSIAKGEAITQDISTLEDPSVVQKIKELVK